LLGVILRMKPRRGVKGGTATSGRRKSRARKGSEEAFGTIPAGGATRKARREKGGGETRARRLVDGMRDEAARGMKGGVVRAGREGNEANSDVP